MNNYETLLDEADRLRISVYDEVDLVTADGLTLGGTIAIRKGLNTTEKACVLAEELAHVHLTVGDITDQSNADNRRQERKARLLAYSTMIQVDAIIKAFKAGCRNRYEIAQYLDVTEPFLAEATALLAQKWGPVVYRGQYAVFLNPLGIIEIR